MGTSKKMRIRDVGEVIALGGIVLSLIFVGLEVRQSTNASRAAAYQVLGVAASEWWFDLAADRELSEIWGAAGSPDGWESLTADQRARIRRLWISALRLGETVHLQIESGVLAPGAAESLGFGDWSGIHSLRVLWPQLRRQVGREYRAYVEGAWNLPGG